MGSVPSGRAIVLVASVLAVVVGAAPATADAHVSAPARAASRVVVSPRSGQHARSYPVPIRVRASLQARLAVRLNRRLVSADFGLPRSGVRTLEASITHGLRRGRNVLKVAVSGIGRRTRRATVRFTIGGHGVLVGAGLDQRVPLGSKIILRGSIARVAKTPVSLRWKLLSGPPTDIRAASISSTLRPTGLTSPGGISAGFRARALGTYRLQLTAASGAAASSDQLTVDVVPKQLLVPIDTMVGQDESPGIRVGNNTYQLKDAVNFDKYREHSIQVVVLDRSDLSSVSNTAYNNRDSLLGHPSQMVHDLAALNYHDLVIVAQQLPTPYNKFYLGLGDALKQIGAPTGGPVPEAPHGLGPGALSAIGVPGTKAGSATVKIGENVDNSIDVGSGAGKLQGYLTPDRWDNYGFVSPKRQPFSYVPKPTAPCATGCENPVGYLVHDQQPFDLLPGRFDGQFYDTDGRNLTVAEQAAEANRMANDLAAVAPNDVLTIQTKSNRREGETTYREPVGKIDKDTMVKLALAVAHVGGTRNGFDRTARLAGPPASGGSVYTLVGWQGAPEGAGAEAAVGVDGAGDAPKLSGVLVPDRESHFRPTDVADTGEVNDNLASLVLAPPTSSWPLHDDPGAKAALTWIGDHDPDLGPNPRAAYWDKLVTAAQARTVKDRVKADTYPSGVTFTKDDFSKAQDELVKELEMVARVRAYLSELSTPLSSSGVVGWARAQTIGRQVYEQSKSPDDHVLIKWLHIIETILHIGGPVTKEATAVVAAGLHLGVQLAGENADGSRADEISTRAANLGEAFVTAADNTHEEFVSIGDIIVSDWAKLSQIGATAGCNRNSPACDKRWAFNEEDRKHATADVFRGIEQVAYQELLPRGFHVFALVRRGGVNFHPVHPTAPNPVDYQCRTAYPFYYMKDLQLASTSLLDGLDPIGGDNDWSTYVIAVPPSGATFWATSPPQETLKRVFGPLSPDPSEGGLALSQARFVLNAPHHYWFGSLQSENIHCGWTR